jgi:hypothetical protein
MHPDPSFDRETRAIRKCNARMRKRSLGNWGLEVAPLAFGGNVFGWTSSERTSFKLLDARIIQKREFVALLMVHRQIFRMRCSGRMRRTLECDHEHRDVAARLSKAAGEVESDSDVC